MTTDQLEETIIDLPGLGESVEEATVTRWLKQPGDRVEAEEPLLEVSTDKVDTEIPAPVAGILAKILVDENEVVAVGSPLAVISDGSAPIAAPTQPSSASATAPPAATTPAPDASRPEKTKPLVVDAGQVVEALPASPPARSPGGAPKAVGQTSTPPPRPEGKGTWEKLPRIRQTIARAMVDSLRTSAQLTTVAEVDVTAIAQLRSEHKQAFHDRTGVKLSFFPFLAAAAVSALAEYRMLNASLNDAATEVTYHDTCHLGIAVDSPRGLMVPVVRDAQNLNIAGLARAIATLADKVRAGKITADDLAGGTFTLTNTGSRGALFDTPIINQPQTGILGTGAVVERVVPSRDNTGALQIAVRSMIYLSITYDHRLVDGADAARFLTSVKNRLETGFTASDLA